MEVTLPGNGWHFFGATISDFIQRIKGWVKDKKGISPSPQNKIIKGEIYLINGAPQRAETIEIDKESGLFKVNGSTDIQYIPTT
jgi:hypothetical protein